MVATLWQAWIHSIASHVSEALGETVEPNEIVVPPDTKLGDFAFACFKYAKARSTNPAALAKEVVEKLQTKIIEGMSFNAAGPYVNVLLKPEAVVENVSREVIKQGSNFGKYESSHESPVVIEYANPNTHKEIHLGHLRNFLTGRAFVSVLEAAGKQVIPVSYVNDQGANVAKTLWWMIEKEGFKVESFSEADRMELIRRYDLRKRSGRELGKMYTEATKTEEEQPEVAHKISFVQTKLEEHDPVFTGLWQETRNWCLAELSSIFLDLGINLRRPKSREKEEYPYYLESSVIDQAQKIVNELETEGIARKSEGALIVDLEEKKLGVMLIRKSDGNLLYASKDLALAEKKVIDYPDCKTFYSVVDVRQSLYFKQLSEVLKRLGYSQRFDALTYELLTLPEGAMSSRKGNIVTYQDLIEDIFVYAVKEIKLRHPEWEENKVNKTAKDLALSGITFSVLKQDPDKILVFDKQQALSFEGATGPYCQYAVTRLNSVLEKDKQGISLEEREEEPKIVEQAQKALVLMMAQLPEKVALAAKELRPSIVAQWCLTMAQAVSAFYRDVPILSTKGEVREKRLKLVEAAKIALSNGLMILGISAPEEM